MALKPSDVAKWSSADWRTKVKFAKPSGGGAVGVMFCWCRGLGSDLPNYNNPATSDFVLKPVEGSAAPSKFAETFMKKSIGALTVNTKPISKKGDSAKFQAIQAVLRSFKTRLEGSEKAWLQDFKAQAMALPGKVPAKPFQLSDADQKLLARWRQVWPSYEGAGAYLIQELASDMLELGDDYKDSQRGIKKIIQNKDLMINLGRLFAVDAVLGNGDRLCSMNPGNILYSSKGGVWAIDSQTILTNYAEIKNLTKQADPKTPVPYVSVLNQSPKEWATNIVTDSRHQLPTGNKLKEPHPVLAPDFTMKYLHKPKVWFDKRFKGELVHKSEEHNMPKSDPPSDQDWETAYVFFKQGLDQGLKDVDDKLSGLNWLSVKSKFKSYTDKYGGDPNMDWTNFKLRRLYIKAVRAGKTEQEALTICEAYALRKLKVDEDEV